MSQIDFTLLVFGHITLLIVLSVGLTLLLYSATHRVAGGIFDPFHFFYSFTFGTAYAVVGLLAYTGNIGIKGSSIVVGYGVIFLFGYIFFSRVSFPWVGSTKKIRSLGGGTMFFLAALLYLVIAFIFLKGVGFAAFLSSRFQIGGYNLLAIILDPLRLFIAAYIAVLIVKCNGSNKKLKRFLLSCAVLAFIVFSSLVNGSKMSFLESVYVGAVAIAVSLGETRFPLKKIIKPALMILIVSTVYAISQMYFNIEASGGTENKSAYYDSYTKGPLLLDLFAMRIVNNGDIYYIALPEPVFQNVVIDHPFALLFSDVFGGKLLGSLFDIDIYRSFDISHQSMGYWYGTYDGVVGPVDHFDLDAYKFFGPLGGIVFVSCLAFIISSVNKLKKGHYDTAGCAAAAAIYIRTLQILLSPHVGLAYMEESFILFGVLAVVAKALNYAVRRPRELSRGQLENSAC